MYDIDTLTRLAAQVTESVERIKSELQGRVVSPQTSKDVESSPALVEAKARLVQATHELQGIVRDPLETIMAQAESRFLPLHIIHEFGVAKAVPLETGASASFEDIAASTGLSARHVRRVVRYVMLNDIFDEPEEGKIVHTAASRLIAEDEEVQGWLDFMLNYRLPARVNVVKAMKKHPNSAKKEETGWALTHDGHDLFSFLQLNPNIGRSFQHALRLRNRQGSGDMLPLLQSLPAEYLESNRKWVDVGGGDGTAMIELASQYQGIQCVVQDLPRAIESRRPLDSEIENRVTFMAYDFFTPQPIKDADVYFLRNILHDWHDEYCRDILTKIREAMKPTAKIVIHDWVLPLKGEVPLPMELELRRLDLDMLVYNNGSERDLADWTSLMSSPGLGLTIESISRPKMCNFCVIVLALTQ